jgi:hypothetical protein
MDATKNQLEYAIRVKRNHLHGELARLEQRFEQARQTTRAATRVAKVAIVTLISALFFVPRFIRALRHL